MTSIRKTHPSLFPVALRNASLKNTTPVSTPVTEPVAKASAQGARTLDQFPAELEGVALRDSHVSVGKGLTLHVVEAGPKNGPPVVLLHGLPEFWLSWKAQIPFLAKLGYRVIVPDLRGYNLSSRPRNVSEYQPVFVAEDIAKLLTTVAPGKQAHVIGHDWGANISWILSMTHPELVTSLVTLGAGHPSDYDFKSMGLKQQLKSWYILMMLLPQVPEWALRANDFALFRKSFLSQGMDPKDARMLIDQIKAHPGSLTAMINYYRAAAKFPPTQALPVVKVPVLAIHGADDHETGRELMQTSLKKAPGLRFVEIPGGHWLNLAPGSASVVNGMLEKFLKSSRST
jgi:epoxide hydrolase 4